MKLVCLGDSLTYGYGVPRRDCWVSRVAECTGHTLVNRGINGDTSGGMLARFGRDVLDERPDRVLLLGGANDIIFGGNDVDFIHEYCDEALRFVRDNDINNASLPHSRVVCNIFSYYI